MLSAITTSFPTAAMFDAGRQPLASIHFNTPKSKTKKSVKDQKDGNVFFPQAIGTRPKIPTKRVDTCDRSADDNIPLALLKQLRSASLSTSPSILRRGTTIRRKTVELDINSESPLIQLLSKPTPLPIPEPITLRHPHVEPKNPVLHVIPVQPKKATILYPLGPVKPMMCIVEDCPYDWHIHLHPSNL